MSTNTLSWTTAAWGGYMTYFPTEQYWRVRVHTCSYPKANAVAYITEVVSPDGVTSWHVPKYDGDVVDGSETYETEREAKYEALLAGRLRRLTTIHQYTAEENEMGTEMIRMQLEDKGYERVDGRMRLKEEPNGV